MKARLRALGLAILVFGGMASARAEPLTPRAEQVLTAVLESGPSVAQIHAAEVLIRFGHSGQVYTSLNRDTTPHDQQPVYRVLYWRALAAAAPSVGERADYRARILAIAAASDQPDRLHAVESAAKLGAVPPAAMLPKLEELAAASLEHDAVFVHWLIWNGHPTPNLGLVARWLGSADALTRLRAAHMLRWIQPHDPAILHALARAAADSSAQDFTTAVIVGAACLLNASPPHLPAWRAQLEAIAKTGEPTARAHALQGLMSAYSPDDLVRVAPLLDHPDPDVRVAAAWVVLQVESRRP